MDPIFSEGRLYFINISINQDTALRRKAQKSTCSRPTQGEPKSQTLVNFPFFEGIP